MTTRKRINLNDDTLYITSAQLSRELGFNIRKDFITKKLRVKPVIEHGKIAFWIDSDLIKQRLINYITRTLDQK
jgi:hypothetical protein